MRIHKTWPAGLLVSALALAGCGGPNAATPDPVPSSTPPPAPAPTPTPARNPGSQGAYACPLPASSNPKAITAGCPEEWPQLAGPVNQAIEQAMAEHPELFNFAELNGTSPRVLNRERYHQVVAENLVRAGVCVMIEREEIAIKQSNAFSEQWIIYTSTGFVRRRYQATCSPAWF
jgi:hypothetical protein